MTARKGWNIFSVIVTAVATYALSDATQAQSAVTLYGLISEGIVYSSNLGGKSAVQLLNGVNQGPRWGLKGSEDLGGGTFAVFDLENGFSVTTGGLGQGGRMFGRQAWVGLGNRRFGTVTLGRQYDEMTQQVYWSQSANQFAAYGARVGDNDNTFNTVRFQNSVRYTTPTLYGLSASGQYALSNAPGAFGDNRAFSSGMTYVLDNLKISAAFSQYDNPASSTNTSGAVVDNFASTSPFAASQSGAPIIRQRIAGMGVGYDFRVVQATFGYSNVLFKYKDGTGLRIQNFEASIIRKITPAFQIAAAYIYTYGQYSDAAKPHYQQINAGIDYAFSKRTDIYLVGIHQRAGGAAQYAQIYSTSASSSRIETQVVAGIRTKF